MIDILIRIWILISMVILIYIGVKEERRKG